jgi:hypothetical protein
MKHFNKLATEKNYKRSELREDYNEKGQLSIDLLKVLFWTRDQTHLWHLQTTSEATHKTLNRYYDNILDLTDRLIETMMGKYGRPTGGLQIDKIEGLDKQSQIMDHLCWVYEELSKYYMTFNDCESLKNIIAECQEEINVVKYLLTLT